MKKQSRWQLCKSLRLDQTLLHNFSSVLETDTLLSLIKPDPMGTCILQKRILYLYVTFINFAHVSVLKKKTSQKITSWQRETKNKTTFQKDLQNTKLRLLKLKFIN